MAAEIKYEPKADDEGVELRPVGAAAAIRASVDYADDSDADSLLSDHQDAAQPLFGGRARSGTTGSNGLGFDLGAQLPLSISLASAEAGVGSRREKGKSIGVIEGVALCVGVMIGSGIFASPGVIARETGSVATSLGIWVFAGLLSWSGALSFCELAGAIPLNGGPQAYLATAFGPALSSMFTFTSLLALKPGSQAIISLIAGEYLARICYGTAFSSDPDAAARGVSRWAVRALGAACLWAATGAQIISEKAGIKGMVAFTALKILAVLLIFTGGLVHLVLARGSASSFLAAPEGSPERGWGAYAVACFSAIWAFDGWDQLCYVSADTRSSLLPKIIHTTMALVLVLFVAANVAYFAVIPFETASQSGTIGLEFGRAVLGKVGGLIGAMVVALSCLGAINGSVFTFARFIVSSGEHGFVPATLAVFSERRGTPINALLCGAVLSTGFILIGSFAGLSVFYGVCSYTFHLATVVALLYLRVKEPHLERPYVTPLLFPITFACTALFLIILSVASRPAVGAAALLFDVAGAVPYWAAKKGLFGWKGPT